MDPRWRPLIERPDRSAVLLDFDGSLSPIVDDPATASVLPEGREALARLAGSLARVAVISGRPVDYLVDALGLPGVLYSGQYGLERIQDGRPWVDPRVGPYVAAVRSAADEAERALPGVLVERKGEVAVALHWRTRPERAEEATRVGEELAGRHGLAAHPGRMVLELRPPVTVDKGTAVESLLDGLERAAFAGDDRGDLAAFDALDRLRSAGRLTDALRVGVRSSEAPPELLARADVVVDGPAGLAVELAAVADALERG
ncbi:MAG: trehalose-phosphatase [Acidimicrobiia bacterium]|nr:trehalose-phosphatase [Acidimicrobiia bacterium]